MAQGLCGHTMVLPHSLEILFSDFTVTEVDTKNTENKLQNKNVKTHEPYI